MNMSVEGGRVRYWENGASRRVEWEGEKEYCSPSC